MLAACCGDAVGACTLPSSSPVVAGQVVPVWVVMGDAGYGDGCWIDSAWSTHEAALAYVAAKGSGYTVDHVVVDETADERYAREDAAR